MCRAQQARLPHSDTLTRWLGTGRNVPRTCFVERQTLVSRAVSVQIGLGCRGERVHEACVHAQVEHLAAETQRLQPDRHAVQLWVPHACRTMHVCMLLLAHSLSRVIGESWAHGQHALLSTGCCTGSRCYTSIAWTAWTLTDAQPPSWALLALSLSATTCWWQLTAGTASCAVCTRCVNCY